MPDNQVKLSQQAKKAFMTAALEVSRRALPECAPNPPVGCVIVSDGVVVAEGYTGAPGRPHAEAAALAALPTEHGSKGITVFVTLEPCSFRGRTPPCTKALIEAGVAEVVVATIDPDPRNNGSGIKELQDAGIVVEVGVLEEEVLGFLSAHLISNPDPTFVAAPLCDSDKLQ